MATFAKSRTLKELLEEYEWELPTSFIDVVFLLLLYYCLTMKFHTMEQRLEAWLPKDKDSRIDPPPPVPPEVTIKVSTRPGAAALPWYQVDDWTTGDVNALAGQLTHLEKTCPKRFQVVIDGTQGCPFKHVMSALDACARAGMTKVEFRPPPVAERRGES